jgi:hypothetical protein
MRGHGASHGASHGAPKHARMRKHARCKETWCNANRGTHRATGVLYPCDGGAR